MTYECFKDKEFTGCWRVEGIDTATGEVAVTIFSGHQAEERARQYYFFITEKK